MGNVLMDDLTTENGMAAYHDFPLGSALAWGTRRRNAALVECETQR